MAAGAVTAGGSRLLQLLTKLKPGAGKALMDPGRVVNVVKGAGSIIGRELPGLTVLGGIGAGGAGLYTAAESRLNPNSSNTLSNRAKGEVANWNTETGTIEKNDWGDDLLNLLTGTNRTQLEEATRKERNKQFNQKADVKIALEKLNAAARSDGFTIGNGVTVGKDGRVVLSDNMDSAEQGLRVQSELERLQTLQDLKAEGVEGLGGSDSVSTMERKATAWRKAQPTSVESQLARSLERQAYTDEMNRLDRLHRDKVLQYDREYNMGLMNHQAEQAHKDRQQTLQFKLMDRQDARLDRADRVAREDRADRRAAIASMVKGLSQLGYAFAL